MIEKNYNEVLVKGQPASKALLTHLFEIDSEIEFKNAAVYHEFPIYPKPSADTTMSANIVFLSQEHGMFIFECINYSDRDTDTMEETENSLDEIDRILFSKILRDSPNLQGKRRTLKFTFQSIIFINTSEEHDFKSEDFDIIKTKNELLLFFTKGDFIPLSDEEFKDLKASLEGSKGIIKPIYREVKDENDFANSKGAILSAIESEINNFDLEQKRAALFILDGAQRIKGLAGSGKTVILAMKAALIHLQYPNARILYTYYTKSLNEIVKNLVTRFYRQFADRDPNWDNIEIMHAWGGKQIDGVYYNTCKLNGIAPISLDVARGKCGSKDPFDFVCSELIKNEITNYYEYTIIDEAQDFRESFYRLCRAITNKNRIIWAYDEFQNILNTEMQDEKETFGKSPEGEYYIDFSRRTNELQDLVLHRCYRTPRKILISAFSLGLAVYNEKESGGFQMVQRLSSNSHWKSLGFVVEKGDSNDGEEMIISRPVNNSSPIKNELLDDDSILKVYEAKNINEELDFIVSSIQNDISKELRPEDISVVCMDTRNVKSYFQYIEESLKRKGINSFNLLNAPSNNKYFKRPEQVTLSTIYNAKGNEAGSIYICSIQAVFSNKNSLVERNKIFTAMTRSKAWVTLSGVGSSVGICKQELEELKRNDYKLHFVQPSDEDVKTVAHDIDKKQELLNEIERFTDDLVEKGFDQKDIKAQLEIKFKENGDKGEI